MKKQTFDTEYIFLHKSKYIRISSREEKNIQNLLECYGTFQDVPPSEVVTACYSEKTKEKFIDAEDYFFFPVHELAPFRETITEKRKSNFLNFKPPVLRVNSKK